MNFCEKCGGLRLDTMHIPVPTGSCLDAEVVGQAEAPAGVAARHHEQAPVTTPARPSDWKQRASVGLIRTISAMDNYTVREYADRLAIWRKDGARLTWEELQAVKQAVWGNRVAVEIYPAEHEVVNLRHTRHLWHTERIAAAVMTDCRHPEFGRGVTHEERAALIGALEG